MATIWAGSIDVAPLPLAYVAGQFAGSKHECVEQYRRHIHEEWKELIVQVYEKCRNQWGYGIPSSEQEQAGHLAVSADMRGTSVKAA